MLLRKHYFGGSTRFMINWDEDYNCYNQLYRDYVD